MNNHFVILGGMGPQASLRLHELLLGLHSHGRQAHEYPQIIHASMAVPDFISNVSRMEGAVEIIRTTCEELPLTSARAIGMACNTAHLLVSKLDLPKGSFVSMIDAATSSTKQRGIRRVGILASPQTIASRLYHTALNKEGIECLIPDDKDKVLLETIIRAVIEGKNGPKLREQLNGVAERLIACGAEGILLGCTELPLVGLDTEVSVIDSLEALALAMLEK